MRPLLLAVVALQVGVPGAALVDRWADEGSWPVSERPASFQVYSSAERPVYTGVAADGTERRLVASGLLRAVATGRVVPDRLCEADPSLVAVRRDGGADPGTFRC